MVHVVPLTDTRKNKYDGFDIGRDISWEMMPVSVSGLLVSNTLDCDCSGASGNGFSLVCSWPNIMPEKTTVAVSTPARHNLFIVANCMATQEGRQLSIELASH